jgi:hypothetical protein
MRVPGLASVVADFKYLGVQAPGLAFAKRVLGFASAIRTKSSTAREKNRRNKNHMMKSEREE